MSSLKKQAVSGVIWTFLQQFSVQIINFGVQIILARLLMPEDFGLIAMITVFISIGQTLMDSGMTSSIIRMKRPDQLDYSTVFVTNFIISIAIYLLIFIGAPFIAYFYDHPLLKDILRVFALTFIIRAFVAVHIAKLTKEMNFKTQMKLQVPSTLVGAIVGVVMAYLDFGVWSLVWLNLTQTLVFTLQNWLFIKWRPSLKFNKRRFKYHFNFGYKLTLSGLVNTIYNDIYTIVIGKVFSATFVGYFNQANMMRKFPVQQLSSVMDKVTYPLFSNISSDKQLKSAYKQTMKLVFFIVVPMMLILIVVGHDLFLFLFGEKWLPAVPYFQILSYASLTAPLSTYNLNILKVKGRSDLFLKLEVVKKGLGFLAVFAAIPFGMDYLLVSYLAVSIINTFINMIFSGKYIDYSFFEQIKDISGIFFSGMLMMVLSWFFKDVLMGYSNSPLTSILLVSIVSIVAFLSLILLLDKGIVHTFKNLMKR